MFCNHKYGKVEDGYQYCEKCGKARLVKCNHKWEEVEVYTKTYYGKSVGEIYVLRCEHCGEMEQKTFGI